MKCVVAMDAFKGSLEAEAACEAVARGLEQVDPAIEARRLPMADGGEGTAEILRRAAGGHWKRRLVTGPLPGRTVEARYAWAPGERTAIIEMASACGLPLLRPEERDPLRTTTHGAGELIAAARGLRPARIRLAIGGSATVDGGTGAAAALGWRFLDRAGRALPPGGGALERLARIEPPDPRPRLPPVDVLCDVDNPLCGPEGAARVFGPQKGADADAVERLEAGLCRLADVLQAQFGIAVRDLPGAGAAGGLGAGAVAFLGARLVPGIDAVMDAVGLPDALRGADWAITGEGRFDGQSARGKVVQGVAREARRADARVLVLAGQVAVPPSDWPALGIDEARALMAPGMTEDEAQRRAAELLEAQAAAWAEGQAASGRHRAP